MILMTVILFIFVNMFLFLVFQFPLGDHFSVFLNIEFSTFPLWLIGSLSHTSLGNCFLLALRTQIYIQL